jgi:hypothetical protein
MATGLIWRSGPVVTTFGVGATMVPISQSIVVGEAGFHLPARIEPAAGLGVGVIY